MKAKKAVKKIPFNQTAYYKIREQRVEKGIKFLDKTYGNRSWVKKIKPGILMMSSGMTCVIGQVFGSWGSTVTGDTEVWNGYKLTEMQAARLGFQALNAAKVNSGLRDYDDSDHKGEQKEYDTLQMIWKDKLTKLSKKK